ncbi:MAG TPA: TonB-dependent receptor [Gemmatimonadota bacterium]|nr:TonB-dependent receptor [Gemmatimonadota bacterium]
MAFHQEPRHLTAHALRSAVFLFVWAATGSLPPTVSALRAQGLTTASIRGTVRAGDGSDADGARVEVRNTATGFVVESDVRYGRFLVQGLEVGGPYAVTVDRFGLLPERRGPLFLTLGEPLELVFVLRPAPILADTLRVAAEPSFPRIHAHGGPATTIPDSLVHRLPTLNRNFYDFVSLAPQVSTKVGFRRLGASGAGANLRFNNFLINGAGERSVNGSVSTASNGAKSLPIDAVKEYQVLVAPYDVRYGDFAGALINTVTRAGTNEIQGSAFAYWRNDRLGRAGGLAPSEPYERFQYGFSIGGPIVQDRVHFFIAPEFQRLTSPAPGPYTGQPSTAVPPVPVSGADVERVVEILEGYGLAAGSGGRVENATPLRNLFARLDAAIPQWDSRAIGFVTYASREDEEFTRSARDTFSLSTYKSTQTGGLRLVAFQFHTDLRRIGGGHNELLVSHTADWSDFLPDVRQPLVRISVPGTSGSPVTLNTGATAQAHGRFGEAWSITVKNELNLPWGANHVFVVGAQAERFRSERGGVVGGYGSWSFSSLDSLEQGVAERYEIRRDFGSASVPLEGAQYAAYLGDEWRASERFSITMGIRADLLDISGRAPYNAVVDSIFGRRTDEMPHARVHLSPRVGFTWDVSGTGRDQLRGGVGVFTGRPPLAWIHPALLNYGIGIGVLRCGSLPTDAGLPPPFVPDYRAAPTACATGPALETAPLGDVDLLDRNLRLAQTLRASLAWDRQLPWGLFATGEALVSRHLSDFMFVNLNLEGPQGVDPFGRVLYGTISPAGVAAPAVRSDFSEVIDLRNTSRNYSYQLSTHVERRFTEAFGASASYTYSRVRDIQSPSRVNMPGIVMWADARALSGRHEDPSRGISLNDLPHRVVLAATYRAPWPRWSTDLSFYYVGESGSPFTYLAGGAGRRGDLNADGSNANDPIYVPRDAFDPEEIVFSGRSDVPGADNSLDAQAVRVGVQQAAFERLIEQTPCLRRQRGRILERNSCREPWSHTTIASVRQAIPIGYGALEAELDVFNVLNLLHGDWGRYEVAAPRLLEHVAQTPAPAETAQSIFRFDTGAPQWTTLQEESAFQLQVALRYRF